MAFVAAVGFVWTSVDAARSEREIAYQQSKERCAGASDANCQQLATAIRSAVADERAADFAAQQLWINILGLLGLSATVFLAGFAWLEARRSADAAHDTLEEARSDAEEQARRWTEQMNLNADAARAAQAAADTARRHADLAADTAEKQLRAYVYISAVTIGWMEGVAFLTVTLVNSGQTPAINVTAGSCALRGPIGPTAPDTVPPDLVMVMESRIGAEPVKSTLHVVGREDVKAHTISRENALYVLGRVRYDDIFGNSYETEFGFFTVSHSPPNNELNPYSRAWATFRKVKKT